MRYWSFILLVALASRVPAATVHSGQTVMGTVLEVTVVAADEATAQRLADEAVAIARRWDDVLTTWRSDGELAQLNAKAGQGPVLVSPELRTALLRMKELCQITGGAFDPAVGALVRSWRMEATPSAAVTNAIPRRSIGDAVKFDAQRVELASGAEIDAGGIGKGMALDAIAEHLRRGAATAAFLNFGGSSQLAIGAPPDSSEGWVVVLAGLSTASSHGTFRLRDAALSSSRSPAEKAAGAIIDPRTRRPIEERRFASVLASDATSAEAWSKAMIVLGWAAAESARRAGVEVLFEDDAGMRRSPGLRPAD